MRKVSFFWAPFGLLCIAACLTLPGRSWAAQDGAGPSGVADTPPVLHPSLRARHPARRHEARRTYGAAARTTEPSRAVALANEAATQPDLVPPPVRPVVEAKSGATSKIAEARLRTQSKPTPAPAAVAAAAATAKAETAEKPRDEHVAQTPLPHEVREFCANTANAATEARIAWQAARLTELAAQLRQRIAQLEAKRAEYEDWLHKHDEAMKEAKEDVVAIYSRMRPDSAAAQLADMDDVMAASLLSKLNSRVASAILAEMDPIHAARIANAMVGPVNPADGKKS